MSEVSAYLLEVEGAEPPTDLRVGGLFVDRGIPVGLDRGFALLSLSESVVTVADCEDELAPGLRRLESGWRAFCPDIGNLAVRGTVASLVLGRPCWVSYVCILCDMSSVGRVLPCRSSWSRTNVKKSWNSFRVPRHEYQTVIWSQVSQVLRILGWRDRFVQRR